jgi:2-C-methyl-D-erythritol 4-phosphate cytidylyltransferase
MKNMNTTDNYSLVVPAGGIGSRLGANIPKQFLKVNGKEILLWTLDAFCIQNMPKEVIISCHKDWVEEATKITKDHNLNIKVIEGGKTRAESVFKGLNSLNKVRFVFVHDAVRPFINETLINNLIEVLKQNKAVIPVLPVSDTIKEVENSLIISTPERSSLYAAQTPQAFDLELLIKANEYVQKEHIEFTDDASIVEKYGERVHTIIGLAENIKITRPIDIQIAELLLK